MESILRAVASDGLLALLMVSLWRDILCKRWDWVTLGMMIGFIRERDKQMREISETYRE